MKKPKPAATDARLRAQLKALSQGEPDEALESVLSFVFNGLADLDEPTRVEVSKRLQPALEATRSHVIERALSFCGTGSSLEQAVATVFAKHHQWEHLARFAPHLVLEASDCAFAASARAAWTSMATDTRDDVWPGAIRTLVEFERFEHLRPFIRHTLLAALTCAHPAAVSEAASALAQLLDPSTGEACLLRLSTLADIGSHEQLQAAGHLALLLSLLEHRGAVPVLARWLTDTRWSDSEFHAQARYAQWVLAGDSNAALEWVRTPKSPTGLSYAAAALADLHATDSRGALEAAALATKNPATVLALREALRRLARQHRPPLPADRMILMFGMQHPAVVAVGGAVTNAFLLAAHQASPHLVEADATPRPD